MRSTKNNSCLSVVKLKWFIYHSPFFQVTFLNFLIFPWACTSFRVESTTADRWTWAPKNSLSTVAVLTRADTSRCVRITARRGYQFFFSQPSKNIMPQNTCSNMITSVMKAERQPPISAQAFDQQTPKPTEHLTWSWYTGSWGSTPLGGLHCPLTEAGPGHTFAQM